MSAQQFKFKKCYIKTSDLLSEIKKIQQECNSYDHIPHHYFIDEEYQDFSDFPCAYTAKDQDSTVGFLCPYILDQYNVEFCLFVLPKYRKQKIASGLFFRMVMDFGKYSYRLSIHPDNIIGKSFLEKMGFTYGCRECSMRLNKKEYVPETDQIELSADKQEEQIRITGIIDGIEVGHLEIIAFDMMACIHDVEIEEKFRRNGYGYRLLSSALHDIFQKYDSVILHVTKENTPAYQLYKKAGFRILEELDYYEL